jgi:hypothetical protein
MRVFPPTQSNGVIFVANTPNLQKLMHLTEAAERFNPSGAKNWKSM